MINLLLGNLSGIFYQEKKQLFNIFSLLLIAAIFDAIGVISILPVLGIFFETEDTLTKISKFTGIEYKYLFEYKNEINFIFISTYLLSLLFRIFSIYHITRFTLFAESNLSSKMFRETLYLKYEEYLKLSKGEESKNILSEVNHVVNGALMARLNLFAFSFVIIAMIVVLLLFHTRITLIMLSVIVTLYLIIFLFSSNYFIFA